MHRLSELVNGYQLLKMAAFTALAFTLGGSTGQQFIEPALAAPSLAELAADQTSPSPAAAGEGSPASGPLPNPLPQAGEGTVLGSIYSSSTELSPTVAGLPRRVYVPNSDAGTLTIIDPDTFKVVDQYAVGKIPHHVAPSWDLTKLYVDNEGSSSLTVLNPATGKASGSIPVSYPYNLYFTPDGQKAVVVAERLQSLEFRDANSWALLNTVRIPWPGVDHLDFTADGHYLLASTEYAGVVALVDTDLMRIAGAVRVGGLPVDVRLSPDGSVFYVANQGRDGVSVLGGSPLQELGFIPTGRGAHGLILSRDTKSLYVSNRLAGSISVVDFATRQVTATWQVGGSPDMLQLSPDGKQLWVSGRFDGQVYVVDTGSGRVLSRIRAGAGAHGLSYFPAPGAHSVGHNGVYRG